MDLLVLRSACALSLALLQVAAWASLGALVMPPSTDDDPVDVGGRLLVGAALTSFAYAVLARFASVAAAIVAGTLLSAGGLAFRGAWTAKAVGKLWTGAKRGSEKDVLTAGALVVALGVYLIHAAAPPRSSDVMRYHLAHLRQIIADGEWIMFADLHYAFPFGWSLNFLPFEYIGLPETAHFIDLAVWLTVAATVASLVARESGRAGALVVLAFGLHPMTVEAVTTAGADAYSMLVTTAVVVGMLRAPDGLISSLSLGFAAWIGAQSRYQLLAAGVAASLLFAWHARKSKTALLGFGGGSMAALLLASPFYVTNARHFGNPVWPLMHSLFGSPDDYSNRIAARYATAQQGSHAPAEVLAAIGRFATELTTFPIPLALLVLVFAAPFARGVVLRRTTQFLATFLLVWVVVQPKLYGRYAVALLPALAIGVSLWLATHPRLLRPTRFAAAVAIGVFAWVALVVQRDFVAYAVTGDRDAFHESTWYHQTFKWLNANVPPDARMLVILGSAQTYPLERWYRRADPDFSGYVDWSAVVDASQLDSVLTRNRIDWVVYDDRDWAAAPAGASMTATVRSAIASGLLAEVTAIEESLSLSRRRRTAQRTRVLVLRRSGRLATTHGR